MHSCRPGQNADLEGMHQDDRRRSTRHRAVAVASLEACGSLNANNQALCTVTDLSRTGIGLETGQPPIKGQGVILRLSLDEEIIEIRARTTRVTRQLNSHFYQLGLDWSHCSEEELSFLDRVLGVMAESPSDH
ncbi:MAG: c-di-GMP-binding flagellar brake protein YcgR [Hyphomicrobiaceae bacterium]|jgi:c-di-GMP-binding flagellar brake protein YcgR